MKRLVTLTLLALGIISMNAFAQFAGVYSIGTASVPSEVGHYATLKAACDALNAGTVTGDCTFYITSSLTEAANVGLLANTTTNVVTFKPYTGVSPTITFTQTTDNTGGGPSGAWVLGSTMTAWATTPIWNIVIDGSNRLGGSTQDLTITTSSTSHANTYPIRIVCDANKITIKNCYITAAQATSYALNIAPRINTTNYIPDSIIVQNCAVTNLSSAGQGISISTSVLAGTQTIFPSGIQFLNNTVTAKSRGIFLNGTGNTDVIGNAISLTQTSGFLMSGIWGLTVGAGSTVNISRNRFTTLSSGAVITGEGLQAINCGSNTGGVYNITNNSIAGFISTGSAATTNPNFYGIVTGGSANFNISNNSINMPNLSMTGGTILYYGMLLSATGTQTVKNNAISLGEDDFKAYAIYSTVTAGVTSDYNDLYRTGTTNAQIGYWNSAAAADLAAWKTATSQDANSISVNPAFTGSTDLSIGSSSPLIDAGTNAGVSTDIFGLARPYGSGFDMGAYEYQPIPAPSVPNATAATSVSFTSFTANWDPVTGIGFITYKLDVATDVAFASLVSGYNNLDVGNVTSYSVTGLPDGSTYYYRLRSSNGLSSVSSNSISLMTLPETPYAGAYYIGTAGTGPGGSTPTFSTLKLACDSLNNGKLAADVTMYITSNLTEPSNVALALNTGGHSLTFKPYTSVTPTINFTQVADNAGPSGLWLIGSRDLATYNLVATSNVIIDGSNTPGGTTQDLTITNVENTPAYYYGIVVFGDADYITIKNVKMVATETGTSSSYAISFRARNNGADRIPDYGTVDNCDITITGASSGQGIAVVPSSTPSTANSVGMVFKNNKITARTRGIFMSYAGSYTITGNTINVAQTTNALTSVGILASTVNNATGVTSTIANNKLSQLATANIAAGAGIIGISIESGGIYNVYNNMIYGFDNTAATTLGLRLGIRLSTASTALVANIYHNSIYGAQDAEITASDAGGISAVFIASTVVGKANIYNNIFSIANTPSCFGIYRAGTTGTVTSDYNNFYMSGTNGKIGYSASTNRVDLAAWTTATGQDVHSVAGNPLFVSATDLHLNIGTGYDPIPAASGRGTGIASVTTDIDGNPRDPNAPDIGADEAGSINRTLTVSGTLPTGYCDTLTVNGSGITAALGGDVEIGYLLNLVAGTLDVGANTLTLDVSVTGTKINLATSGSSSLAIGGVASGVNVPSSIPQVNNLTIKNPNGATLEADLAVNGTLTFTSGKIDAGSYTLTAPNAAVGAGAGKFVQGALKIPVTAAGAKTWATGNGTSYLPVSMNITTLTTGDAITVKALDKAVTAPAGVIGGAKVASRYFRMSGGSALAGFTADMTLSYAQNDITPLMIPDNLLRAFQYDGVLWNELTVASRDTVANTLTVSGVTKLGDIVLSASTLKSAFSIWARTINFGTIDIKNMVVDTMYVKNLGGEPLTISGVTVSDTNFNVQPRSAGPIAPNDSAKFAFTYDPAVSGTRTTNILFAHNAATSPDTVTLTGAAEYPQFAAARTSVSFGDVAFGIPKKDSVMIKNTSSIATLNITAVTCTDTTYKILPASKTLAPLDSALFYVTFTPATGALANATVYFIDDVAGGKDSIAVNGKGALPGFNASKRLIDFGNVAIHTIKSDTMLVANTSISALRVDSVTHKSSLFSVIPMATIINSGDTARFAFHFAPLTGGVQSDTMIFYHNAASLRDTIAVTGFGVLPTFASNKSGVVSLGPVRVGRMLSDTIVVSNASIAALQIDSIRSTNAAEYFVAGGMVAIAPGGSEKVGISFTPNGVLARPGGFVFYHNGVSKKDTVFYTGTGIQPAFAINKSTLPIGNVTVNMSGQDSVLVTNTGTDTLAITGITSLSTLFTVSPLPTVVSNARRIQIGRRVKSAEVIEIVAPEAAPLASMKLAPSASAKFTVTFAPVAAGVQTGKVIFAHDAPASAADTLTVNGTGVQPTFAVTKQTISFGNLHVTSSKQDSLYVKNGNVAVLKITSIASSNVQFVVTPATATLNPGDSVKIFVTFTPGSLGVKNANILFTHNAAVTQDTVTVTGTGILPVFSVASKIRSFGSVLLNTAKRDSMYVKNTGTEDLVITAVTSDNGQFTINAATMAAAQTNPEISSVRKISTEVVDGETVAHQPAVLSRRAVSARVVSARAAAASDDGEAVHVAAKTTQAEIANETVIASTSIKPADSAKFYLTFIPTSNYMQVGRLIFVHNALSPKDTIAVKGAGVELMNIQDSRSFSLGTDVAFDGVVTRAYGSTFRVQDTTAAVAIKVSSKTLKDSIANGGIRMGDKVRIFGRMSEYGKTRFVYEADMFQMPQVLSRDNKLPAPKVLTLAQLKYHTEQYESQLVQVENLRMRNVTDVTFQQNTLYYVKDPSDSSNVITMITPDYGDGSILNTTIPSKDLLRFVGVISQYSETSDTTNYVLQPILATDLTPLTSVRDPFAVIPDHYELMHNFPNPFNPTTTIRYALPKASKVSLRVYNILGAEVSILFDGVQDASFYQMTWNGRDNNGMTVASGVYFYRVAAEPLDKSEKPFAQVKKMMLLK